MSAARGGRTLGGRARGFVLLQLLGMDGIWDVHTSGHISADGHWPACRVAPFDLPVESIHLDRNVYQGIGTKKGALTFESPFNQIA